jgi:hypothetical protein
MDSTSHRFAVPADRATPRSTPSTLRGGSTARRLGLRIGSATLVASMAAVLLVAAPVAAASPHKLFVSTSGSDAASCSRSAPCQTIGHAIDIATPGSKIVVRSGTYHETLVIDKRLKLVGHHARIDASGLMAAEAGVVIPLPPPASPVPLTGWAVLINGPAAAGTVFKGFTVQHAAAEGILAYNTSRVRIKRNELTANDQGAAPNFPDQPVECMAQGPVPGDCGEAIHLLAVASSRIAWNNVHNNVGGILLTDEIGPTHGNLILHNTSRDNAEDCGITLPSHNPSAATDPTTGGVYDNMIVGNWSIGNGGAGVGMFAAPPGAASYDNQVIGNVLRDNGEAGVGIHSHAPGQNVSGNLIAANRISGNGVDPDFQGSDPQNTGIAVGSAVVPVSVRVVGNWVSNEYWGLFTAGDITVHGLVSNHFAASVSHRTN